MNPCVRFTALGVGVGPSRSVPAKPGTKNMRLASPRGFQRNASTIHIRASSAFYSKNFGPKDRQRLQGPTPRIMVVNQDREPLLPCAQPSVRHHKDAPGFGLGAAIR